MSAFLPRILNREQVAALRDADLVRWYQKLKFVRQSNRRLDSLYDNPRAVRWCYYEARRELTRRGLRNYDDSYSLEMARYVAREIDRSGL